MTDNVLGCIISAGLNLFIEIIQAADTSELKFIYYLSLLSMKIPGKYSCCPISFHQEAV